MHFYFLFRSFSKESFTIVVHFSGEWNQHKTCDSRESCDVPQTQPMCESTYRAQKGPISSSLRADKQKIVELNDMEPAGL